MSTEPSEVATQAEPQPPRRAVPLSRPFAKAEREDKYRHRGLLLYALQDEDRRSLRLVSRALQRSDRTIRNWCEEHQWHERIARAGDAAQTLALREYTQRYGDFLVRDSAVIEPKMSIPFRADVLPPPASEVPGGDNKPGAATKEALRASMNTGKRESVELNAAMRRHKYLLEAVLAKAALAVKDGQLKAKVHDLPGLIRAHKDLEDVLAGRTEQTNGGLLQPSVRVVEAQRRGEDITEAMLYDAEECVAVLRGIQASKQIAREVEQQRQELLLEQEAT